MNRNKLKTYAPQARREFIKAVTDRAGFHGLTAKKIEPVTEQGDVAVIGGKAFPKSVAAKRKLLEQRIARQGFEQVMEAMAYTWFNRFVAIRYMELHGYLDHGYRVLSNPDGSITPEIVEHAEHVDLPKLDKQKVIELKLEGTKESELFKLLLLAQCHALHQAMPFLFEPIDDETELLLPENLLHSDSVIRKLVAEIPEEDWQEVEIIGWLYQFYISEKKDEVIGKVVNSEDIPAATQLFTPNWIVKYLVQNSLGRQWVATYPDSPLKAQMEYYIEPAEQTPEVQEQLAAITPKELNPEELTLLDPACGSGHILVEAYDLLKAIYQERGYRAKDIPRLILEKNLYGLEIDDRAAQLAAFALMMKARADDRRIFEAEMQPNVLAIQESKGLDAREITEALNAPLDGNGPTANISQADVAHLINLFEHGKTFGSLIRVPRSSAETFSSLSERIRDVALHGDLFGRMAANVLDSFLESARLLSTHYSVVAANPPYMGGNKAMNSLLKSFAEDEYPDTKYDLFAMFVERGLELADEGGFNSMIVMEGWMFLSSYQRFRESLLSRHTIMSLVHMPYEGRGRTALGIAFGTAATVLRKTRIPHYAAHFCFIQHTDLDEESKPSEFPVRNARLGHKVTDEFKRVPGSPIAYWASEEALRAFDAGTPFGELAKPRQGLATSDNSRFLRLWHEVDFRRIGLLVGSRKEASESGRKWFPYNKGGPFRRWYGNNTHVINWENDGSEVFAYAAELYGSPTRTIKNADLYFLPCVTWTFVSSAYFGVRRSDKGFVFDVGGSSAFPSDENRNFVTGFLSSSVALMFMRVLNPTLNFQVGNVAALPVLAKQIGSLRCRIDQVVERAVEISRLDWDATETSWDFGSYPLLQVVSSERSLERCQLQWASELVKRFRELKELEEENNRLFINAYELHGELSPNVPEDQITLYHPDREEDIKRLISYAIGCMMGRYSLDEPGLIYAHTDNKGFDPTKYKVFPADQDGIIPITDTAWFPDDASNRFVEFIAKAWPRETLEENLKFVAESLGPKKGESSRDTIRRYLSQGFYKHHLSMYKKRPIYWLFSSGKQRAFECLVYLHRYNEGTLSRMRTEYIIPLQGKIEARIDQLKDDIASATSTAHGKRLQKERDKLIKQQAELRTFDEKLRHCADQRISLDLDDGVKVNYDKFGDLLAEVKAITGQKAED